MSDELTATPVARVPYLKTYLLPVLVLVLAGTALGGLMGVLWEWVWTPPTGAAWEGKWFLDPDGLNHDVDATGWFVTIGLIGGIVYGAACTKWCKALPLVVLVGVVLGSFMAAWAMYQMGHLLGPPDPHVIASTAEDWDPIVSDLRLAGADDPVWPFSVGSTALLAPPMGALISLIGIFLGGTKRSRRPVAETADPTGA